MRPSWGTEVFSDSFVVARMPGLTISRTNAPFLNKIKDALSWTKVAAKESNAVAVPASSDPLNENCPGDSESQQCESSQPDVASYTDSSSSCQSPPFLTINDLPPEILATIFHTYMFWEDESDLIDPELEGMVSVFVPNPRSAPLLFCNVCSYWRNVATSTPALWSAIFVYDTICPETVALWLQRSQSHSLSLFVSLGPDLAGTDTFARLLEMFYANMARWKRVSFHLPTAKDMRRLVFDLIPEPGKSPATQLQHLCLSSVYHQTDHLDFQSLARLSSFPHPTLQRFSWSEYTTPDFARIPTTLWLNLQQITFSLITERVLLSFLKACDNLRFIDVKCLHETVDADLPAAPIVAHNLEALNVGMVVGKLNNTIAFLTAPKLKRLSLRHRDGHGTAVNLENFIKRSRCMLECLCIICKNPEFGEDETNIMLRSPIFMAIPHFSLRLADKACHASFPQAIIAETAGKWKDTARACHEPTNYSYHLGWGSLDIARLDEQLVDHARDEI
ncbi:hypothetical protein CVT24_007441 [Panaeolus cyanescens]|uniref:Uncharacterized protein n=1 Tax=Panaeolus cyanescens TaxID=181874 RepID=A0A409W513_9AGAR|nr:hypothetical protein CVT24_007441 [Panaeolus cyanescens]